LRELSVSSEAPIATPVEPASTNKNTMSLGEDSFKFNQLSRLLIENADKLNVDSDGVPFLRIDRPEKCLLEQEIVGEYPFEVEMHSPAER
jgi:hypothetical protein